MRQTGISERLRAAFQSAIARAFHLADDAVDPLVRASADAKFGDYQCNAAMALAKQVGAKPRDVAEKIKATVEPELESLAQPLEIAGPGFLNIRLRDEALADALGAIPAAPTQRADPPTTWYEEDGSLIRDAIFDDAVSVSVSEQPQRVIIDYSAPNIAKQMHVGHLRSTIIGDVLARVLTLRGHRVLPQNHVGDWGTQFGMLIAWYANHPVPAAGPERDVLALIEEDYRSANERFKSDPAFAEAARLAVGRLQGGDMTARYVWMRICAESARAFGEIYDRLGVLLRDVHVRGESFYNDRLAPVIQELREALVRPADLEGRPEWGEVRNDQGAVCIFLYQGAEPKYKGPEGDALPVIVQKSDGAYLYATTDLAAIRYRICELGGSRLLYVVGAPTRLHLDMIFTTARAAGWADSGVDIYHCSFGQVLGEDRKLLRTRTGGAVKLRELLDEAERRAAALLDEKLSAEDEAYRATFSNEERAAIAKAVGIASIKYFDLARDRNNDYVFNWDHMLAMKGNTAPYMLFAYASIRSIFRKALERLPAIDPYAPDVLLDVSHPAERALALRLLRLEEAIVAVEADLQPHVLCTYLYDLAGDFMKFYAECPVLTAETDARRASRLRLCDLTARTLRLGLRLVGIEAIERM